MATALQIINRALRLCQVKDAAEVLEGEDSSDALETLNAMLAEWHEADIALPDYSFATLTTELASDVADREAIAYQLAIRLAPEYDVQLSPAILGMASDTMARLRLRYFQPGITSFAELPSAQCGVYNITTDE